MANREVTYVVKLNTTDAKTQAGQLSAMFQAELKSIKFNIDTSGLQAAGTEAQNVIQRASEAEKQATATTKAAAQERVQAAKAESQERIQAAKASSAAQIEEEKRVTAQVKTELQAQAQAAKQKAASQSTGSKSGGIGGALVGAAAGYFTVQGARYVAQQSAEFANLGTQVRRTEAAFTILSGGAQKAAANIDAIKTAGGGAIDNLKAMELANQSLALNLAKTPQEFGNIVRAGREVALVSPVIHDVESAISELGLAASNLSYRRLDQLGLTATEVKAKMKELQSANSGLDDSSAFLAASLELLDKKYGTILSSAEAAASGTEKLQVAFSDLYNTLAAGALGKAIDEGFGDIGNLVAQLAGSLTKADAALGALADRQQRITAEQNGGIGAYLAGNETGDAKQIKVQQDALIAANNAVKKALLDNVPGATVYKEILDSTSDAITRNGEANEYELLGLQRIVVGLDQATRAYDAYKKRIDADPEQRRIDAQGQTSKAEDKVAENIKPISDLAENLKTIGIDNFFQKIQDGLSNSAELTVTATNKLQTYRDELESIAKAVAEQKGIATPEQVIRVDAVNAQINSLTEANKLLDEFKKKQAEATGGNGVAKGFDELNQIVALTKVNLNGFYAGAAGAAQETIDKVNVLAQAYADFGSLTAGQQGIADTLLAQGQSDALNAVTQTFQELNSGAFDAVPGIDAVTSALEGYYSTLASGGSLTDEQAAQLANLSGGADSAGGSMDALSGVVNALGFEFLDSNTYAQELVNQIISLALAQGSGAISGDQFAGSMSVLTGKIWAAAEAAGVATPQLWAMLDALNAVNAASGAAPGQVGGGIYTGQGPRPGLSPSFVRGQQIAEAAAAQAKLRAETSDRNKARAEAAKAAKEAEAGSKKAANAAEREFENAAKATERAFKDVADKIKSALEKVPGLFSASKVTQEDLDIAKAGGKVNYADDFVRRFADLVDNNKNSGVSIGDVQAALGRVGIQGSGDPKALLAQLRKSWEDQSLFSNKDNLQLINKDAVKDAIDLQTKAADGKQNILDYFGASIDAVKEQFKAGDPTIVGAVADELGQSQDKNIRDMAEQLKTGGQQIIDKVLDLAQASIDKSVAGLDLGDGVSFGGGGGGGGVGGGKLQGIVDSAKEKVVAKTSDFLSGVNLTGENGGIVPVTGQITELTLATTVTLPTISASATITFSDQSVTDYMASLAGAFKSPASKETAKQIGTDIQGDISAGLNTFASGSSNASGAGSMATTFMESIDGTFSDATVTQTGHNIGTRIQNIIGGGLTDFSASEKDVSSLPIAFLDELGKQFSSRDVADKAILIGGTLRSYLATGVTATPKKSLDDGTSNSGATAFIDNLLSQFSAPESAEKAIAVGTKLRGDITKGLSQTEKNEKGEATSGMASAYFAELERQFNAATGTNAAVDIGLLIRRNINTGVSATGEATKDVSASPAQMYLDQLKTQFETADVSSITSILSSKINGAFAPKRTVVAPGAFMETSSFDFNGMAESATQGLSAAFGTQTDFYTAMGDTAAVYIGYGFGDHDFSGAANNAISQLNSGFMNEANTTQLVTVGNNLADTIHDGFTGRIQSQDWMGSIVSAILASVMNGLADSLKGTK